MRIASLIIVSTLYSALSYAGELPDPAITPGAIDPEVTAENIQESICKQKPISWSQAHLPPSSWMENLEKSRSNSITTAIPVRSTTMKII